MKCSCPWLGFGGSGISDCTGEWLLGAESEDYGMCLQAGEERRHAGM